MTNDWVSRRAVLKAAATGAGSLLLDGCCACKIRTNYRWNNALQIDGVDARRISDPASLAELVSVVNTAESENASVRMVGSGHSFSDVAFSEDYLLRPSRLTRILPLNVGRLRPAHKSRRLVQMQSGVRIRQLNPYLSHRGLALQNMGGWDSQTIVGAAITGTHGSGLNFGPLASQIVSMVVVTAGGGVVQLEPTDGITDPALFTGQVDQLPAKLVQDDELFHAVAVSMGCMGLVYSVVLEVVPRFWLREKREFTTWGNLTSANGFLTRLMAGQPVVSGTEQPEFYEIYFNPYPPEGTTSKAAHECILTTRYRLTSAPGSLSSSQKKRGKYGARIETALAGVTGRGAAIVDYLNARPDKAPDIIRQALRSLRDDEFVAESFDVFNLGPANELRAYGIECGFHLDQTIAAAEHVFDRAADLASEGAVHNTPPSLRFVAPSQAHLSMSYGRPSMMLEMGMFVCANDADKLLGGYERSFMQQFNARPHWGLDLNQIQDWSTVERLYPQSAAKWKDIYDVQNGTGVFDGPFTDRLGISKRAT